MRRYGYAMSTARQGQSERKGVVDDGEDGQERLGRNGIKRLGGRFRAETQRHSLFLAIATISASTRFLETTFTRRTRTDVFNEARSTH